jgi:anti-sigma factor RsiW
MRAASCKTLEPKLSAYVDGELPLSEREDVEAHLARCGDCARMAAVFRGIDARTAGLPVPRPTPAEWAALRDGISRRAAEEAGRGVVLARVFRWWPAAAAALVVLGLALLLGRLGGEGGRAPVAGKDGSRAVENFAEWRSGAAAEVKLDEENDTLYLKYQDF